MEITAFTDGSSLGNPGPGGWAAYLTHGNHGKELVGAKKDTTNNEMEMMAILQAVRAVKAKGATLWIVTDSQNAIGWLSLGWKCNTPHIIKIRNQILMAAEKNNLTLKFEKVKAHSGHFLNEYVNLLAQKAAEKEKFADN